MAEPDTQTTSPSADDSYLSQAQATFSSATTATGEYTNSAVSATQEYTSAAAANVRDYAGQAYGSLPGVGGDESVNGEGATGAGDVGETVRPNGRTESTRVAGPPAAQEQKGDSGRTDGSSLTASHQPQAASGQSISPDDDAQATARGDKDTVMKNNKQKNVPGAANCGAEGDEQKSGGKKGASGGVSDAERSASNGDTEGDALVRGEDGRPKKPFKKAGTNVKDGFMGLKDQIKAKFTR